MTPRVEAVLEFLWAMRGKKGDHRLLVLERLRPESRHALVTAFRTVLGYEDGVRLVEPAEVARVLAAQDWNKRYIGGAVDRVIGRLVVRLAPAVLGMEGTRAA